MLVPDLLDPIDDLGVVVINPEARLGRQLRALWKDARILFFLFPRLTLGPAKEIAVLFARATVRLGSPVKLADPGSYSLGEPVEFFWFTSPVDPSR